MVARKKQPEPSAKTSADGRIDANHHHYRIIAGRRNAAGHAIVYLGRRKFDEVIADTVEAAVEAITSMLDEHRAGLRRERTDGVPTTKEFREALTVLEAELPASVFAALGVHVLTTNASASIVDLTRFGAGDEATVTAGYTRLGRRLAAVLEFTPEAGNLDRAFAAMQSFALVEATPGRSAVLLRLRPQVVAALGPAERTEGGQGLGVAASSRESSAGSAG